jgi:hypothetical protein
MTRRPIVSLSPTRHRLARAGNLLVCLAAGVWLGTILAFGLTAASTFGTIRDLAPSLTDPTPGARPADAPDFTDTIFDAGQPDYLAGRVVNGMTGNALMPVSIACLVALTLGLATRQAATGRVTWAGNALGFVAFGCFIGVLYANAKMNLEHTMLYDPTLDRTNDAKGRDITRSIFDFWHLVSERLFGVIALTQLALLGLTTLTPLPPLEQNDQAEDPTSDA